MADEAVVGKVVDLPADTPEIPKEWTEESRAAVLEAQCQQLAFLLCLLLKRTGGAAQIQVEELKKPLPGGLKIWRDGDWLHLHYVQPKGAA